jgi:hypothetical protein
VNLSDAPTIAERYVGATQATNLKMSRQESGEGRCQIDIIAASGFCTEDLGRALLRLRNEFADAKASTPPGRDKDSDAVFIAMGLPSRPEVRAKLVAYGVARAKFRGYAEHPEGHLEQLIGRTLSVWLDPLCRPCDGRGYTGGGRHENSGPRIRCAVCGETGKRKQNLGHNDGERAFAGEMMDEMNRMCGVFVGQLKRGLR